MSDRQEFSDYPRYAELAYASGSAPEVTADFKTAPEDFVVEEILGFSLSGEGEHLWLWIEATDMNTDYLVKQLASAFSLETKAVSFSGKKDRRAVTRQWFSLHLPGQFASEQAIILPEAIHPDFVILEARLHHKKLRRGTHQRNRFKIRLRNVDGDIDALNARLTQVSERGFPNYFGFQRFGHHENNLGEACAAMNGERRLKRQARDRVYSTLRAWDFNRQLHKRVATGTWQQYLPGDTLQLSGSHSLFQPEVWDDTLQARLEGGDIQIAGILPGKGKRCLPLPDENYEPSPSLLAFLARQRLDQGTRPFATRPEDCRSDYDGKDYSVSFTLPRGAYATSLFREIICLKQSV